MNGSFPFLTTDLTHVTCELQSSSAHHSLWLSGRASYSICRIPFYNRTFFLLIINSKTVNGHICTLSLPPPACVRFLPSLSCPSSLYKPSTSRYQATCETPNSSSEQSKKKKCKEKYWNRWLIRLVMRSAKNICLENLAWRDTREIVLRQVMCFKAHSFPRTSLSENFSLLRTDKAVVYIFYVTQQKGYQNTLTRLPGVIISVLLILACPPYMPCLWRVLLQEYPTYLTFENRQD